jgi:two-component system LytT family response regulator
VLAEARDVRSAMSIVAEEQPDVVFLDLQLPDGDGFGVVDLFGGASRPAIVAVSAHADDAVRAFEVGAVDYLLKPIAPARLFVTLQRVRDHLGTGVVPAPARAAPVSRIPVMSGGKVRFVDVTRIEVVRADRNYVRINAGTRPVLVRSTLREMEQRLPQDQFCRVSRSAIVRLDRVVEVEAMPHGELTLRLAGGEQVISGRAYSTSLRAFLGL